MGFRQGDRVLAASELGGGLFDGHYVPEGTPGVVIDVDGGFISSPSYTVTFTVDGGIFSDKHHTVSRLDETDLRPR